MVMVADAAAGGRGRRRRRRRRRAEAQVLGDGAGRDLPVRGARKRGGARKGTETGGLVIAEGRSEDSFKFAKTCSTIGE